MTVKKGGSYFWAEIESNPEHMKGFYEAFYLNAKKRNLFARKDFTGAVNYGNRYLNLKKQGNQYEELQRAEKFLYLANKAKGKRI